MESAAVVRLVAERDIHASRTVDLQTNDCCIRFVLATITAEQKREVRQHYDVAFPVPPVISIKMPQGSVARFNLEDADYQTRLTEWQYSLSYGVLAATMGMTVDEVKQLEGMLPNDFMSDLFTTAELINGVQSEPLSDLIREALWAPEVLTWIETYKPKGDEIAISDKPMFRQMEAMVAFGWSFEQWEAASPRERMLVLNWYDYRQMKEAYINWNMSEKTKSRESTNPMRALLPR